jgi:hypothetical protein
MTGRRLAFAGLLVVVFLDGCGRPRFEAARALPQRGYLWQREWSPAVIDSLAQARQHMNGVVVLFAEIVWEDKKPRVLKPNIDWKALQISAVPCAAAVRIAPFSGPFSASDQSARFIVDTVTSVLREAKAHQVKLEEFQLDFDCAQKNLAGYAEWVRALRPVVGPLRLVITTLPAWLDEPEFVALARATDGYVLQVHSVPLHPENGRPALFDGRSAQKWVNNAARLGLPFSVALPTYRCAAGFDASGKLLGVAMDSVQPAWPSGTRTIELATDADEVAKVVAGWDQKRPKFLRELLWYRIPVARDTRNWKWETLRAVMAGRPPLHALKVLQNGTNPIDLAIGNDGEADEQLDSAVVVTWKSETLVSSDAVAGWTITRETNRALFQPPQGSQFRLAPNDRHSIGWLRFAHPTTIETQLAQNHERRP